MLAVRAPIAGSPIAGSRGGPFLRGTTLWALSAGQNVGPLNMEPREEEKIGLSVTTCWARVV